jgi:hypothetical protein
MTTRTAEAANVRGERTGWRSHTFGDGTCSITLTAALDSRTAERLRGRLRELGERGCERLIVDVSGAIRADDDAPALLAGVLRAQAPNCEVVAVVPRNSPLDGQLPARVAVAWSLSDARMLLATRPTPRATRAPAGPGEPIPAVDRHTLAIRQVLRWAAQAAGTGDYENALRALSTIERVEGELPGNWEARRQAWISAAREHARMVPGRTGSGARERLPG